MTTAKNNHFFEWGRISLSAGKAHFAAIGLTVCLHCFAAGFVLAQDKTETANRIVVIVDDDPISEYEILQRMQLTRALSKRKVKAKELRKDALKLLVDEHLQMQDAARLKIKVSAKKVADTIAGMAKRSGQSLEVIKKKLKRKNVSFKTLEQQVRASIAWNSVVRRRFSRRVRVDPKEVTLKFNNLKKNPRPGIKLLQLKQVILPVNRSMVGSVESRRMEAVQIYRRFKGCRSLKRVSSSVFNVRISKTSQVPASSLHPQLRKILLKIGPGRITPPSLARNGVIMIAYCGNKQIKPPDMTRQQVQNGLMNQQFGFLAKRHLLDLRRDATIEYR